MKSVSTRWDPAAGGLLAVEAKVVSPETALPIADGAVTLDATSAVRGRLDLTISDESLIPTATTSLLAPYGNEISVSRGITYADGTSELVPLGVFGIQQTTVEDTADGLVLKVDGLDRSQRFADARLETQHTIAAGTNYGTAILELLQVAWPDVPYDFTTTSRTTPLLFFEEGADRWELALGMAESIGMDLYFDGEGTLRLTPLVPGPELIDIVEGEGGMLLSFAQVQSRVGRYNAVIVTGENPATGVAYRGVARDLTESSPTYYYGPFGPVPRFFFSEFINSDEQAEDAAEAMLARELGADGQINFGSVPNPALEPGDVVRITRERAGVSALQHILDSVSIPLTADEPMTGTTRRITGP